MLVFSYLIFQGFELPHLSFSFVKQILALRLYPENKYVKVSLQQGNFLVYTVCRDVLKPKGVFVFVSVN